MRTPLLALTALLIPACKADDAGPPAPADSAAAATDPAAGGGSDGVSSALARRMLMRARDFGKAPPPLPPQLRGAGMRRMLATVAASQVSAMGAAKGVLGGCWGG